jgi:hypothetical protein
MMRIRKLDRSQERRGQDCLLHAVTERLLSGAVTLLMGIFQ